jgi:hypothetical protein
MTKAINAQEVNFEIMITDEDRIIEYESGIPVFDNEDITEIFSNYTVTYFAKANPLSNYQTTRMLYRVTCDSIGLAEELCAIDSILFPYYEEFVEAEPLGYHVSDSGLHYYDYLWFVRADEAWLKSRGDSNFVIGLIDTYFDTAHEDMQNKYVGAWRNVVPSSCRQATGH